MLSEEVLRFLSGLCGSHVVTEQVEFSDTEMPCEIQELESGVAAEVDVVWRLADSVSGVARAPFNFVRILVANFNILRPQFTVAVLKSIRVRSEPPRITKIKHIQKVTNAISIIETE